MARSIPRPDAADDNKALDQRWNFWRSPAGTPSIPAMTVLGTGNA